MSYIGYAGKENPYSRQSTVTASPGDLVLMLYDGAVKHLEHAKHHIEQKDFHNANESSKKAQKIIDELMRTLNMKYDVAREMLSLYTYILDTIMRSNVKKDTALIDEAIELIADLRNTWQEAVMLNRQQTFSPLQPKPNGSYVSALA